MLVLTNLKCQDSSKIFESVQEWLQITFNNSEFEDNNEITQLRDQICAGFFLIFCTDFGIATGHLENVKEFLVPEYFEALKGELEKRKEDSCDNVLAASSNSNSLSFYGKSVEFVSKFLLFLNEIAHQLLDKMKQKHALLVAIIKSNYKNFVVFCQKLIQILISKLNISIF